MRALLCGESWVTHSVHIKGVDSFSTSSSGCAPHWAPPEFLAWPGYQAPWPNLVAWLAGAD
jgi:uncharacterized membrane protein